MNIMKQTTTKLQPEERLLFQLAIETGKDLHYLYYMDGEKDTIFMTFTDLELQQLFE